MFSQMYYISKLCPEKPRKYMVLWYTFIRAGKKQSSQMFKRRENLYLDHYGNIFLSSSRNERIKNPLKSKFK